MPRMNVNSLHALSATRLSALQPYSSSGTTRTTGTSSLQVQSDGQELSPFARLLTKLQSLQQSDPTRYKELMQKIADRLKSAAATATEQGDSTAADSLTRLAQDFAAAATSGDLPGIEDLARAMGGPKGPQGPPPPPPPPPPDSDSDSTTDSTTTGSTGTDSTVTDLLQQLIAALQAGSTRNSALDPMSIIDGVLQDSGIES
jgi:hypothetical protein